MDFATGAGLLGRIVAVFVICGGLMWMNFSNSLVVPVLLGGIVWSFFPLLDYWSTQSPHGAFRGISSNNKIEWDPEWYARWYSEIAFMLVSIVIGYFIGKKSDGA